MWVIKVVQVYIAQQYYKLLFHQPNKYQRQVFIVAKKDSVTPENIFFLIIIKSAKIRLVTRDSQNNMKVFSATFDLQKLLLSLVVKLVYFITKKGWKYITLKFFDIGIYLYDILKFKKHEGCNDFSWSDNCTSQNRSRITFFMYAAEQFKLNVKHTFLEVGHS